MKRIRVLQEGLLEISERSLADDVDLEMALGHITEGAARLLEVPRTVVWLKDDEQGFCRRTVFDGAARSEERVCLDPGEHPRLFERLDGQRVVSVSDVAADPRVQPLLESGVFGTDVGAVLGAPVRIGSQLAGGICFEHFGGQRQWTEPEQQIAASIGDLVAIAVKKADHERSEQALRAANERLDAEVRAKVAEVERVQQQLLQSEKMASIGQLAAGVAHEINNPIGYIGSNITSLEGYVADLMELIAAYREAEREIPEESAVHRRLAEAKERADLEFLKTDLRDLIEESKEGLRRVKQIIQDLKDFSRISEAEWEPFDLHQGIDSTLNIVWNELKYKAEVIREFGELPTIECVPSQINQVFMNLLVNAAHAIEERGTITIRTGTDGEQVWAQVEDTGKGIAPENLPRLFDPFFTTKPVGKGTGLGLSVSFGIVQKHGGRIDVDSEPGKGSRFTVYLPVAQGGKDADTPEAALSQVVR